LDDKKSGEKNDNWIPHLLNNNEIVNNIQEQVINFNDNNVVEFVNCNLLNKVSNNYKNNKNFGKFSKSSTNLKIFNGLNSKKSEAINDIYNELKFENFKSLLKKKFVKQIRFTYLEMFLIKFNCFLKNSSSQKLIQEKISNINQAMNYLDFYTIIKVLRDSILLKKIILTKDQLNGMKFLQKEFNIDHEWKFSDNDIVNFIKFKNRGISFQKNNHFDQNILELIPKEIKDLL